MAQKIATILVAPKTLYREALARLLANTSYKPVRIVSHVNDVLQGEPLKAGKLLFLVISEGWESIPAGEERFAELELIKLQFPDAPLVVLSGTFDAKEVVAVLRAGANGYVLNTLTCQALIKSFDLAMCGQTVLPSEFARAIRAQRYASPEILAPATRPQVVSEIDKVSVSQPRFDERKLSRKENAILTHLSLGDTNKTIARSLGIAETTVKTHVKAILRKIGVRNRTQAALWAFNNLQQPAAPEFAEELK